MTAFVSKVSDSSVSRNISPTKTFVRIELIVHFKLDKFRTKCCVINSAKSPTNMKCKLMVHFLKEKSKIAGRRR